MGMLSTIYTICIVKKYVCVILLFFKLSISVVYSQIDSIGNVILNNLDSLRMAKVDFGAFNITPYLAPTYSPETQWMLSGGGLITFKVQKENRNLNLSSIPFSIGYSSSGALNITLDHEVYWTDDRIRFIGGFTYRNMPDHYWGVGYSNGVDVVKSDTTTAYTRHHWKFKERVMFSVASGLYIGPVVDFNYTLATGLNERMASDPNVVNEGTEFSNAGIGFFLEYDTRDFPQNAYEGIYLGGNLIYYRDWWVGKTNFQLVEFDYRQYKTLGRKGQTLAWQIRNWFALGDKIPWTDLAMLGGKDNLRGYTLGRFRDQQMVSAMVEYRHMFKRKTLNKKGNYNSRWGYVVWGGTGSVASSIRKMKNWLPNGGLGIRFELQPRMNIRCDYGRGKGEDAFYITFSEAF
ncbi:hypothetical protein DMA11_01520 [Marinilabiliaceae bacterium JC017]|nr:hypothetical protein DMA11_01520 [Marinilabiliaceae bacterium JC017]